MPEICLRKHSRFQPSHGVFPSTNADILKMTLETLPGRETACEQFCIVTNSSPDIAQIKLKLGRETAQSGLCLGNLRNATFEAEQGGMIVGFLCLKREE